MTSDELGLIHDIEELGELIQAIAKHLKNGQCLACIIEELADVEIAIRHIKKVFNISDDELERMKQWKRVERGFMT